MRYIFAFVNNTDRGPPVQDKRYKLALVERIDPYQTVHPYSQIKIYTVHISLTQACSTILSACLDSDENQRMNERI